MRLTGFMALALGVALAGCGDLASIDDPDPMELDATERARVRLGHGLFFDPGLSGAGDVACASCHAPSLFGADGLPRSEGTGGSLVGRNAPSVFNAALKDRQFWDGRVHTLEEQVAGPLFAVDEMGQTEAGLLAYVGEAWAQEFDAAFPGEQSPTLQQVSVALAAYERMLSAVTLRDGSSRPTALSRSRRCSTGRPRPPRRSARGSRTGTE